MSQNKNTLMIIIKIIVVSIGLPVSAGIPFTNMAEL